MPDGKYTLMTLNTRFVFKNQPMSGALLQHSLKCEALVPAYIGPSTFIE